LWNLVGVLVLCTLCVPATRVHVTVSVWAIVVLLGVIEKLVTVTPKLAALAVPPTSIAITIKHEARNLITHTSRGLATKTSACS
jgi:hypothetical protein